jgi:hypothetical protein
MKTIESALEMEDLLEYINGDLSAPTDPKSSKLWKKANACVQLILINTMEESVNAQLSHLTSAKAIWDEARRLFARQTITDYTMTITNLVTTKYQEDEDIMEHIAKFRGWKRDLQMMARDIPDDLFACFLQISMPLSWNYVFTGLPTRYTAEEIERRIKDESGVCKTQESAAAYQARTSKKSKSWTGTSRQISCTNCKRNSHLEKDCWSKGGGLEGKGPRQKKRQNKKEDQKGKKGKKRTNQAVGDSLDSNSGAEQSKTDSAYLAMKTESTRLMWILDGGSTTYICKSKLAFTTFTTITDSIGGINMCPHYPFMDKAM